MNLKQIRWAVRAALFVGVAASIAGNVLHAHDNTISRIISAWSPMALLITIELIARVPVHHRSLAVARWAATALIAGIAAWVSYWHMAAVAARYGETGASPYLLPLSVDGLVVVASVCLVELGGRIREEVSAPVSTGQSIAGPVFDHPRPIGPVPALALAGDKLSTPKATARKRPPSSRDRVAAAHNRTPSASDATLAARLEVSEATVKRHRPARPVDKVSPVDTVNGREPELEAVSS